MKELDKKLYILKEELQAVKDALDNNQIYGAYNLIGIIFKDLEELLNLLEKNNKDS